MNSDDDKPIRVHVVFGSSKRDYSAEIGVAIGFACVLLFLLVMAKDSWLGPINRFQIRLQTFLWG